ncbi:sulfite exporter TauE/SafE family protein [Brevundimonas sp. TWP2-3-4b1]|uniref:sulfite exporter TauE/SafE family protein n=1 Tax=Brevundimonas sp. TWP2-3-4b1 TaxID=2804580 RepID=UPI003CF42BE5
MLLGAGMLAGAMNAVAGGGTFVALPVLMLAGLPPTMANASSTVALFPGTVASGWAYRRDIQPLAGVSSAILLGLSVTGGLVGALFLLFTPEKAFGTLIPWLLLLATVTLAAGPRANTLLRNVGLRFGGRSIYFAQFLLGIYGGYFGGAVGLMMLAVWGLATTADLRQLTPLRTVMVAAANGAAVLCFAATGLVSWAETSIVMIGGILGGYVGARLSRRLPANVLRGVILFITVVTTAVFFARAY